MGLLSPMIAGAAMAMSSVSVVTNALRLRRIGGEVLGGREPLSGLCLAFGDRPSELEAKFLLLCLFGLGSLAQWADSEAVLPAYVMGMVLAGTVGKDHALVRRLRTVTFGLLTPFYFIKAGLLVSLPAIWVPDRAHRSS